MMLILRSRLWSERQPEPTDTEPVVEATVTQPSHLADPTSTYAKRQAVNETNAPSGPERQITPTPDTLRISVGIDPAFPPMEFISEKGLAGFDVDLLNAVAQRQNMDVTYRKTTWDHIFAGLEGGDYDAIISAVTILPEREEKYDFTDPYINAGQAIVVRADESEIAGEADLSGHPVGAQVGATGATAVEGVEGAELKEYDSIELAFLDLVNGNVDAVVVDTPVAADFALTSDQFEGKLKIVGEPLTEEYYAALVRKGENSTFISRFNEGLEELKEDGTYGQIYEEWFRESGAEGGSEEGRIVAKPVSTIALVAEPERGDELTFNLGMEPPTLDPALARDTTSVQCDQALFLGLTDFDDETMEPVPELASEWSVSNDGLVWTFKMRDNVLWVRYDPVSRKAEGLRKVTAHDVVYGVRRTINPETASDYAYVDYIIKNAEAVNTGESTDLESIGVRAVDDFTVEFTLEQPAGYFPAITGMWVNRPQPKEAIVEHGAGWTEPGNIVTNGPYCLDTWEHENQMIFVANPHYYGYDDMDITQVNCVMVTEDSTAFAMYENGELDVQAPPLDDMDRIKADPQLSEELYIAPDLCTYYYGYNVTKPPFDNKLVRQAFSYALDRGELIETVTKGGQRPATTLAPPGIFGTPAENPDFPGITYDPERAQELLAEAGYPNGEGLPEITLMYNSSEGHQKIAEFVQQSWKDALGVEVKLANQEWGVYLDTLAEDAPQIYRFGWCGDYPDENAWVLEVFHPQKGANRCKWDPESESAQEFMSLTEQAAAEPDPAKREELYFEAEKILCADESIIIPIYYFTKVVCTKPYMNRTYAPFGGEHWEQWAIDRS